MTFGLSALTVVAESVAGGGCETTPVDEITGVDEITDPDEITGVDEMIRSPGFKSTPDPG